MNQETPDSMPPKGSMDIQRATPMQEIDIPNEKHSWLIRVLLAVAAFLVVAGGGIGYMWYRQNSDTVTTTNTTNATSNATTHTTTSNTTSNVAANASTANTTNESSKVSAEAAAILDEVKTAPEVNDKYEPVQATTSFAPDTDAIYVAIKTKNLLETKQLKVVWEYTNDDTFIDDVVYAAEEGINRVAFHLEKPTSGSWPLGKYAVSLYVDGTLAKIVNFTVAEVSELSTTNNTEAQP